MYDLLSARRLPCLARFANRIALPLQSTGWDGLAIEALSALPRCGGRFGWNSELADVAGPPFFYVDQVATLARSIERSCVESARA